MSKTAVAKQVMETSFITGEFLLRSGQISNEYFDKYRFEAKPELLKQVAELMVPLVPEGTELLAGLEMGGIPLATMLSQLTGIPTVFVRKKPKEYGTRQFAEGNDVAGKRVVIVEDVITSGGQLLLSANDLREAGAIIEHAVAVIDRQAGGIPAAQEIGIDLRCVFTMSELKASVQG